MPKSDLHRAAGWFVKNLNLFTSLAYENLHTLFIIYRTKFNLFVDFWERLCSAQAFSIPLYYCLYSELYLRHINHCNFPTVTFSFSSYVSSHTGPPTKHSPPLSPYWFLGLTSVHLAQRANSLGKDSDAWKYWRQEEEEVTADKMVG